MCFFCVPVQGCRSFLDSNRHNSGFKNSIIATASIATNVTTTTTNTIITIATTTSTTTTTTTTTITNTTTTTTMTITNNIFATANLIKPSNFGNPTVIMTNLNVANNLANDITATAGNSIWNYFRHFHLLDLH